MNVGFVVTKEPGYSEEKFTSGIPSLVGKRFPEGMDEATQDRLLRGGGMRWRALDVGGDIVAEGIAAFSGEPTNREEETLPLKHVPYSARVQYLVDDLWVNA